MNSEQAVRIVDQYLNELTKLVEEVRHSGDYDAAKEKLRRWKDRTASTLASQIHPKEGQRLQEKHMRSFIIGEPIRNLISEADMYRGFLVSLREELVEHPEAILAAPIAASPPVPKRTQPTPDDSSEVFIIHGHDELNLLRLKQLLTERWGLKSLVLKGKPGKGRTLIEKFEDEAKPASYAFALLTPDDVVETTDESYTQPRPNVVFELGWFYGRLGRERVCILHKKGTKIHSDLEGITRIEFAQSVEEKIGEIESELHAAKLLKPK